MSYRLPRRPQFFYTTAPLPCPYLAGRTERKVVTEITGPDADALHDRLSRAGFRRSHNIAYAPVCPSCQACIPIRIPVATFQPGRTLRKIWRANALLEGFEVPARATAEQFQLFQRYQTARHGDGDMATMSFYDFRAMVEDTPIETFIVEFRDPDDRMISACLTDRLGDGLSAVYSFFAPALERRSLGTHAILWLIERARLLGLPYVYLGYWVPESRKMAYKSRFRPAEVLAGGAWRMLTEAVVGDGVGAAGATLVPEFGGLDRRLRPLGPQDIAARQTGDAVDVHAVSCGAEGEHGAALAVGGLLQRALQRLVHGQCVALGEREVLDREHAAVGMEDVGILAAASCHIEAARAGDELVAARIGVTTAWPVRRSA